MIKKSNYMCTIIAILLIFICGTVQGSSYKESELSQKMAEIASLQQRLSNKIALAMDMKQRLQTKMVELKEEIIEEKQRLQIDSFEKAILIARIDFDLKLVQQLDGYIIILDHKIVFFQTGRETLNFYFQQVQDDMMMIKTLDDLEIDKLIAQINMVLEEYIPVTSGPMFDVDKVPLQNMEKIWNEVIQGNPT